jgi:hypothetical protein
MLFHPIDMYNLHPNDPIELIFSPVIPLAKFKSMGKMGKRLSVLGVYNFQCENVQKCQ